MRPVDALKPVRSVKFNKVVCIVNSNKTGRSNNSSKFVRPVDICKSMRPVNSNKILPTNKPANSKTVHPVNSSNSVRPTDVRKLVHPENSNKPVYREDVCKSVPPADVCGPVCLVDIHKLFFVNYGRYVILFLILLFFVVSVNTKVFHKTIQYMITFINIQMTCLSFTNSLTIQLLLK